MGRTGPEDLERQARFHRLEWRVQRIGWVVLALVLGLAFAGLFGGGPLSNMRAESQTGRVDYERFVRYGTPGEFFITPTARVAGGVSRVEITASFLEAFGIERITPEPTTVRMAGGQLIYEFAVSAPGTPISFQIDPHQLWSHCATVRIDGGTPLEICQFTYP